MMTSAIAAGTLESGMNWVYNHELSSTTYESVDLICLTSPPTISPPSAQPVKTPTIFYASLCECVEMNGLCTGYCTEIASGPCAQFADEVGDSTQCLETVCYNECLSSCVGYESTN